VIPYLLAPPDRDLLVSLIERMGITPHELLRQKGTPYLDLGLDGEDVTDDQRLDAMMAPDPDQPAHRRHRKPRAPVPFVRGRAGHPARTAAWPLYHGRRRSRSDAGQAVTTDLPRRLTAEVVGTALLVATVIGSGIMADRLSGGNDGLALLANALAMGAMLVVLITILGPLSGAHFNPVVSAVMAWRRDLPFKHIAHYIAAQCAGGVVGAILANLMFDLAPIQMATTLRGGGGQWLSEVVATFTLIGVILGGLRHAPQAIPLLVGLTITGAYWFTASTSFANPAVTLARTLSDTFAGIAPVSAPSFILAQCAGGSLAAVFWGWLFAPSRA
jgi:glycerol uptake facilitator-like aquaporin